MAFAGDHQSNGGKHTAFFRKVSPWDGVFMHHSGLGIVGYGIVKQTWDTKTYEGDERLLYKIEPFEYRIAVEWDIDCDCREKPLPLNGCLPYMGYYCHIDQTKWKPDDVINELKRRRHEFSSFSVNPKITKMSDA
jgi:hypothetical protein